MTFSHLVRGPSITLSHLHWRVHPFYVRAQLTKDQLAAAEGLAEEAERRRAEAEGDVAGQRRETQELLEKLLREQRDSFQRELETLRSYQDGASEVVSHVAHNKSYP